MARTLSSLLSLGAFLDTPLARIDIKTSELDCSIVSVAIQSATTVNPNTWTMTSTWVNWLFLLAVLCFVHLDCEIYQDRPKIKTSDGDLILEPALDKNIYLRPNGPKSSIYVGNVNILNSQSTPEGITYQPYNSDNVDSNIKGILARLERLEAKNLELPIGLLLNISLLYRKVNNIHRKVLHLESQINFRAKDECQSNPCEHGGTCLNLVGGYHCLCPSNWEGRDCDVDVNECRNFAGTDLGCQNGATCINRPGTYECLCKSGWFGLHCTRKAKDCSGGDWEMCGHGTCVQVTTGEGIQCLCHQGWTTNGTGVSCLTDINECESYQGPRCSINPKVECINLPGSFRCGQCPRGYEGDGYSCTDIDECTTIPNGGCSPLVTCHNTIGSRICGPCPPDYQGDGVTCDWRGTCNIAHGGCHPSAQCIESPSPTGKTLQCICPEGMTGDGVGISGCYVSTSSNSNYTEACKNNPCGTHGQCHSLRTGYTCICYKGYGGAHCESQSTVCAVNPCQNGGICRPDDSTIGVFRCECTAQYSGPLCQVRTKSCGGVLDHEEGSIVYPLTNTTYTHNSQCAWVIHTSPDKVINVTFSKFNLEGNDCAYDFLQIHDGRKSSSQLIGRFCGNNFPKGGNIVSSHNNLYFWFHSDSTVAKDGFALHWTSIKPVCGGEVDATTHGHISSPGSPGPYPPNRDCYWHLTTTLSKRINLHFFDLDIESHTNCSFDYLAIYDGEHLTDPLIDRYCNSTQPAPVHSAGSDILIHFHSDAYSSGRGFQIAYAPIEGIPGCGGYYTADKGEIISPTYNGAYLSNLLCEYKIKTSAGTKIKITFKSFKLERSFRCKYDYFKIYDGPSSDARVVGKFCGNTYPNTYTSTTNSLYLIFRTDRSMSSDGFRITYEAICEQTIVGDSGIIKSPGYPFSYPANKVCVYIIATVPGKAIQLTFQDFDIEDSKYYDCRYDNVEVRDGHDNNSTLLGRYCGGAAHTPPVQTSTLNYMYIRFQSDMSLSGTGFYANYTTINTDCGGVYRETTGLINHPSGNQVIYKNYQTCKWILIAPEGMHIKLTWNRFDVEDMPGCTSDYLKLIEVDDDNENQVLGTFCGSHSPPALTTSTNRLMLQFESDGSIRSSGFSVSYSFLDVKTHCSGNYIKTHGYIYSPGWPKSYEPNRDCTWIITVPVGQQIKLNITQFNLERPIRSKCNLGDYLEIRNGGNGNSPLIGQYCGEFESKIILSLSNAIHLHFHSDYYLTGTGFKIEWDGTITGCGGTLTSPSGSISSPNYPNNYDENAECFYRVVTSAGSKLRITFTELDLERTPNCRDDYIEIYDGRSTNANSLGKHCFMSPELGSIETSTNYAYIKFRSDIYQSAKGFMLNYQTICTNNVTGRYGVIESPGFPSNYPSNLNCLWSIHVPKSNKINVTFIQFDIYKARYYYRPDWSRHQSHFVRDLSDRSCNVDYLQVKEISDPNYSDRFCGSSIPQPISTKSNAFQIKFVSSAYMSRPGFRLEWTSYGCGGHIQKQMGIISIDKSKTTESEMECEWLIETRPGKSLSITFIEIFMTDTHDCITDAIEIYNGQNVKAPLLMKLCHNDHVSVQSDSNFMLVRFIKRSTLKDVHFSLQFRSKTAKCGGYVNSRSGLIYSKNYPHNYDNNLDCIWYITVPSYHRVELNFLDLDLYSMSKYDVGNEYQCEDSIQIYDNNNYKVSSNYTYRICPNSNITQIISKYNVIVVQFKTDDSGTAKGFKANFTVTCGATLKAEQEGLITSDNFVNNLNKSCIWTIVAPTPDQKIYLMLTLISLPKDSNVITNRNCPSSYLRVRDGDDEQAPLIGEYCGRKVPPMIVSRGSALTIEFGSYTGKLAGKFSAHYSPVSNACGGTLFSEEGTIASPNYPGPYPGNTDCEWIIKTSAGYTAYVQFERFNLPFSESCNGDYVEIRESNGAGRLLGVYCDNEIPTNHTIASQIYIKFHSNSKSNGLGFLLHYGLQRENNIQGESGEITSPLYPSSYLGSGEYVWRVMISGLDTISISIDKLQIYSPNEMNYNKLSIYDGYDTTAPILEELNGVLSTTKLIQSSSSVVYITFKTDESNTGSWFHMSWARTARNQNLEPQNLINCGSNQTEIIYPGHIVDLTSPNYPNNYKENLNCEWVYRSQKGRHLAITFLGFEIEETSACFADSVSIYSSDTPGNWKPVKENMCTSESASSVTDTSTYMKVTFKSDSTMSRKGFRAHVVSRCGGILTDLSGQISPNWWDSIMQNNLFSIKVKCEWTVKVRPGRTIQVSFTKFNITNNNDECSTYVMLRNGDSAEAPTLASGKYCGYEHEKRTAIITSSNSLYVSYTKGAHEFETFTINYEEKNDECGSTSTLAPSHDWEIISSPNYPLVPVPFSECEWVFYAPPGEILRLDFIDRFDLDYVGNCETEAVEIRDGSSRSSPPLGRFCSERPGTVKSSSNAMYIKYFTQLTEPRNGFKANVTIDTCGGTIIADSGEVTSPGYPHMQTLPYGTVCKWHIIGPPRHIFLIKPQDVQLPQSETPCATRATIEEAMPVNNSITVLKRLCFDDNFDLSAVETSRNNFTISLYIGKPDSWDQISENRGFRISFNSTRPMCGGVITAPEGYLTTPSYPQETTLRYCQWFIMLPNKSRKVRLDIIDLDAGKHRIALYNDITFHSLIQLIPSDDYIPGTTMFETTGSKLAIYVWLNRTARSHRFKAKFTSDEPSLCGGELSGLNQEIISPDLNRSYTCEWHYNNQVKTTDNDAASTNLTYNSIFLNIKMNSSVTRTRCRFFDPRVVIKTFTPKFHVQFSRDICGNIESSYIIPAPVMDVITTKSKQNSLYFHVNWKSQPCGGEIQVEEDPTNILNVPDFYNDTLDCAWVLSIPVNNRVEFKMEGSFTLECEEEFLKISQNFREDAQDIGHFCKEKLLERPLITHFSYMYVQYHSNVKNKMNLKLMARTVTDQCGGYLSSYQHTFASPNYPKQYSSNQECSWEIRAQEGYRVSLHFVDRFFIEESANCTKDVVIIYDWNNDDYTEMARVCGRQIPPTYNSTHNRMKVVLRTDADINQDGFKARWNPICGGSYTAVDKVQILYSPGYPYSYPSHMSCSYEISAPNNNNIILKFLEFELEGSSPMCNSDNLTISAQSDYHYLDQVYCGSDIPPIVEQFSKVSLRFKSDSFIQRRGFKISYSIYHCGGKVNDSTVLSSTLVDTYNENLNCTWFIEAPSNKIVVLKFLFIDLEGNSECYSDYIAVYEGLNMDSDKRLALLCGHLNSTTILRSKGNTMLLQFVTDSSISFTGFKVQVYFSYSESAQCGGKINLSTGSPHVLKTPLMGHLVYENYLDCLWSITSPPDTVIKISFTSFHISPCENVNQTALGYSNCNCDLVEIRDGLNPNSLVIGTYCGHSLPPLLSSSGNLLSVRLSTDGELGSHGFEATLTAQQTLCGRSVISVSNTPQRFKSPGFDAGSIPRGIHCTYSLEAQHEPYSLVRITVISLDLRPAVTEGTDINRCNNDKLLIYSQPPASNITLGKDFVVNHQPVDFFNHMFYYDSTLRYPNLFELCELKMPTDYYVYGSSSISIITSAESDSKNHKGVEIEVAFTGFCGRNYSEPYGQIQSTYSSSSETSTVDDCYTLITAPENYTISAYFISSSPDYWDENCYLDIFDGNSTSANRIIKVHKDYDNNPVFSMGRYMLLHNHVNNNNRLGFNLNYIITNKGPGCGGKLQSEYGRITSPLYPNSYRRKSTCEWELETPINTRLLLRFSVFDLGITCDQNYLQLVNSKNVVVRTFCAETPADYTSDDHYVKVVFVTTQNNGGTGWLADFIGILT